MKRSYSATTSATSKLAWMSMEEKKKQSKAKQSEATIRKLLEVGREMFAKQGYAQTATEELVREAGVTRGALYHHFNSKEGLFRAVFEQVQKEIAEKVENSGGKGQGLWDDLVNGCKAFLETSLDRQVQQIVLIDAPAVLGWEEWRRSDAENSLRSLKAVLASLMYEQYMDALPVEALAHLLSGAMNEAALWIARADEPQKALEDATTTLEHLLEPLRRTFSK
jgi:AcrR family transcriptional regulator